MKKPLLILTFITILFISACNEPEVYTIQFDVNGGETLTNYEYTFGDLLEMPTDPTREGYEFVGWYYDKALSEGFSLKEEITRDLILYAKWEINEYTVTIDYNNGDSLSLDVEYGSTIEMPQDPEKVRSVFDGWFEDNTFVTEFDFDSPIVADTSMIAKWVEDDTLLIGTNIYTFNDNFMFGLVKPELERYAGEREVEIEIVNSEYDQSLLNDQVDAFIESGVDVLAINLVDISAARTIINKAKAADIPLIFFSKEPSINDMATYDKVWYVGVNDNEAGTKQGEMIVADWQANTDWDLNDDGVIDYVLLKGEPGHPVAEARTLESIKALTDAGYTVNELALAASPYWSTADAKNTMEAWLTSAFADQIEVVICNNDGLAFGAIQALDAADKALPVYGADALEFALELIGAGDMAGTVLLDGEGIARTVIDLAINAAQGNDVLVGTNYILDGPLTKAVRVPFVIINKDNYEDYLE